MIPKGIRESGVNQQGARCTGNCLPSTFRQVILVLFLGSGQGQIDSCRPAVLSKRLGRELAPRVSPYAGDVQVPIVSYVAVVCLVPGKCVYNTSRAFVRDTVNASVSAVGNVLSRMSPTGTTGCKMSKKIYSPA